MAVTRRFTGGLLPQFFGDERHERMQQEQNLVQRPGGGRAGLRLRRLVVTVQDGLVSSRYQSQNVCQTKL